MALSYVTPASCDAVMRVIPTGGVMLATLRVTIMTIAK